MTKIDLDKIAYASYFSGLANYSDKIVSFDVPAQTLDGTVVPGDFYRKTHTEPLSREYAISEVKLQYDGLDNVKYLIRGRKEISYNGSTRTYTLTSTKYDVDIYLSFKNDSLNVLFYILPGDFNDSSIEVPAFTVKLYIKLFVPPFEKA